MFSNKIIIDSAPSVDLIFLHMKLVITNESENESQNSSYTSLYNVRPSTRIVLVVLHLKTQC